MMKLLLLLALSSLAVGKLTTQVKSQRFSGPKGYVSKQATFGKNGVVNEADNFEDIFEINQKLPNLHLIGGDIAPSKQERNAIIDQTMFWPNARIPVVFANHLNNLAIAGVQDSREEYELRTCLSFPDKEGRDKDYVSIESQGGCWSYVGLQGGKQTLSLGSGCENAGIVIHELMHAAGVQHEQCRTDRDGYISVEEQNIDPGLLYNFDKYNYNQIDIHRVPYDYYSVMHYSDTSFSTNGEKTILTLDPQFQFAIGQRRTLSEGDATLLNRMYSCVEPKRVSYSCDFEERTVCGYVQGTKDETNWMRYIVGETDGKLISSNIPQTDSTYGSSGKGSFMLLDTSSKVENNKGHLISMRLKTNTTQQCLEFSYYLDTDAASDAGIAAYLETIDQLTGEILDSQEITTFTGNHGSYWNKERVTISAPSYYKLLFVARSSKYENDVIAIDDITIQDKACASTYFLINDYSTILANSEVDDYFYGPKLYSEEGYAFQIVVYPQGRSSNSRPGYMSIYLALVQGDNDDSLEWPMHNRVIKIAVVDQNPDSLKRMSVHGSYLTSGSGYWDKPASDEPNPQYGWGRYMRVEDLLNTWNFVKNDAIMISINFRNMNNNNMARASVYDMPVNHDSDNNQPESHDININVVLPRKHDQDEKQETMSTSLVAGIAIACSLGVLLVMGLVMVCMNQTHKEALQSLSFANYRLNHRTDKSFNNLGYDEAKA